jgi:hypothetical protein
MEVGQGQGQIGAVAPKKNTAWCVCILTDTFVALLKKLLVSEEFFRIFKEYLILKMITASSTEILVSNCKTTKLHNPPPKAFFMPMSKNSSNINNYPIISKC